MEGQNLKKIRENWPKLAEIWPKTGRKIRNFGRFCPKFSLKELATLLPIEINHEKALIY